MSGELCPSCTPHTLWPGCNVTQMSWAEWSAQLWRCKDFSIVWEENDGLCQKACIQENETIDKHLKTFICERNCLLQSLRKDLFIISPRIIRQPTDFITPVTNLNINKSKMLRENAAGEHCHNCYLESLNSLTGTALLPWWNGSPLMHVDWGICTSWSEKLVKKLTCFFSFCAETCLGTSLTEIRIALNRVISVGRDIQDHSVPLSTHTTADNL